MVGRRGPAQAAFTTPELHELGELAGADVIVDPADLEGAEPTDTNSRAQPRGAARVRSARAERASRSGSCCASSRSPVALLGDGTGRGGRARAQHARRGRARASPTDGEHETLPAGIVFRSVGYRGVALPGVPFDERSGTIPNERGRVAPGVYVAGWIKRGPSGVIGTNKKDATETVELLLEDLRDGAAQGAKRGGDRRTSCSSAACGSCSIRAGRRSTSSSAPRARSSAARA